MSGVNTDMDPILSSASVYTRGRDPISLLRYEAGKKPDLARLCECAADLSDTEIDAAPYLPWIRNALRQVRTYALALRQSGSNKDPMNVSLADFIVDGRTRDPEGVMFEYTGDEIFVKASRTQLQIPYGKLFFLDDMHQVWVETVRVEADRRLFAQAVRHGPTTKTAYREAVQARLLRLHPDAPQTVCVGAQNASGPAGAQPLAHLGVTIQR